MAEIPVDEVKRLASSGRSEEEIIDTLRSQGYSNEDISEALNRALKFTVGGDIQESAPRRSSGRGREERGGRRERGPARDERPPPPPEPREEQDQYGSPPGGPESGMAGTGGRMGDMDLPSGGDVIEMTAEEEIELEALIEEIINEKWRDVEAHMSELDQMYTATLDRVDEIEARTEETVERYSSEGEQAGERIEELSERTDRLEGKVNSLERAFKEFLPELTEDIRELSNVVEDLKSEAEEGSGEE